MSTISASTTSTTAYKVTADTTGTLVLQTGASPTTAVTIDTSQNVGIGTSTINAKLHVNNGSGGGASSYFTDSTTGTSSGFQVGLDSGHNAILNMQYNAQMLFSTNNAERMRIDSSGNVGIGTSSPAISGVITAVNAKSTSTSGSAVFQAQSSDGLCSVNLYSGNTSADNPAIIWQNSLRFGTATGLGAIGFTERARIDSSGNLTMAGGTIQFTDSTRSIRGGTSGQIIVTASSGGFYQYTGSYYLVTTAGGSTSDETLKKNMQPIQNALSKVCAISGITYEFIDEPMCDADKGTQIGVGAQTVEVQFPEIVLTQEDGKKTVRYDRLVAPLIEAIKELNAKVDAQAAEIAALKGAA